MICVPLSKQEKLGFNLIKHINLQFTVIKTNSKTPLEHILFLEMYLDQCSKLLLQYFGDMVFNFEIYL